MITIIFITGNQGKLNEAKMIMKDKINIINKKIDLDEIQSLSVQEVIKHKLNAGKKILKNERMIVEDTGLYIKKLNGFPGALIKFFMHSLGDKGISKLVGGSSCFAMTIIGYYDGKKIQFFEGKINGTIAKTPKGKNGFGWDTIFIPKGHKKTFAEMSNDQKNNLSMRKLAFTKMYKSL